MGAAGCPCILREPGAGTQTAAAGEGEPRPGAVLQGGEAEGCGGGGRWCLFTCLVFLALPVCLAQVWVGLRVFTFLSCSVLAVLYKFVLNIYSCEWRTTSRSWFFPPSDWKQLSLPAEGATLPDTLRV